MAIVFHVLCCSEKIDTCQLSLVFTAQKMKFSIKDFFGLKLRIWSHLLTKPSMESFIFCAVIFSFSSMFYRAYFTVSLYKYIITGVVNITMIHLCCLWVKIRNRMFQVLKIDLSHLTTGFH